MRTSGSSAFGTVFGLALLLGLLAGAYFLFKYVTGVFATLEPQAETLAWVASIVALLCAVIIAEGLKARGQREAEAIAAAEKAGVYQQLLSACCAQWTASDSANGPLRDPELVRIEHALALQGSGKVISAYLDFRRADNAGNSQDQTSAPLSRLVQAMRADLGRSDVSRGDADLLELLSGRRQNT